MKSIICRTFFLLLLSGYGYGVCSQEKAKLYNPELDGMKQITEAVAKAGKEGKHVLVQYGGNWCGWCIRFDAFSNSDPEISNMISSNFVRIMLNYSPENKNEKANEYLGNASRFGFPVFIIIDGKGKVLHIQDSALLEEGSGYNRDKVLRFFKNWTVTALKPVKP